MNCESRVRVLQSTQHAVMSKYSSQDQQFVTDQIRTIEKKLSNSQIKLERKQSKFKHLSQNMKEFETQVEENLTWLQERENELDEAASEASDSKAMLLILEKIYQNVEDRHSSLDSLSEHGKEIMEELAISERNQMKQWIQSLQQGYKAIITKVTEKQRELHVQVFKMQDLQKNLEKICLWLQDKEQLLVSKFDTVGLQSSDIDWQIESCKSVQSEVVNFHIDIEKANHQVQSVDQCEPRMLEKISDINKQYSRLEKQLNECQLKLQTYATDRRQFETDLSKVESWCRDVKFKCRSQLHLDCAADVLAEQLQQYKDLEILAKQYEDTVADLEKSESEFSIALKASDTEVSKQQLYTLRHNINRASSDINERLEILESALSNQIDIDVEVQKISGWLETVQFKVQPVKSIGPMVEDAQAVLTSFQELKTEFSSYEPAIVQLQHKATKLSSTAQMSNLDIIQRILTKYFLLADQVTQLHNRCKQAVSLRSNHEQDWSILKAAVKECQEDLDRTSAQTDLPVTEQCTQYKAIYHKLNALGFDVTTAANKVHQIDLEGCAAGSQPLTEELKTTCSEIDLCKKDVDKKIKLCEQVQEEHQEFEKHFHIAVTWLEQKQALLSSHEPLEMDPEKINICINEHQKLFAEALNKIEDIRSEGKITLSHLSKLHKPAIERLSASLEHIDGLESKIITSAKEREKYLMTSKTDRMQFEKLLKLVTAWLNGAEELLAFQYEKMDYENIQHKLEEQKEYFSETSLYQDKLNQILEIWEHMMPSLDCNDRETLKQSLNNITHHLATTIELSQKVQDDFEQKVVEWNQYQDTLQYFNSIIQRMTTQWSVVSSSSVTLTSQADIDHYIQGIQIFLEELQSHNTTYDELYEKEKNLESSANHSCQAVLHHTVNNVTSQWKDLFAKVEAKLKTFKDFGGQWTNFSQIITAAEDVLCQADRDLPDNVDITVSSKEIFLQCDHLKVTLDNLIALQSALESLKTTSCSLQKSLPTAGARIQSQEQVMLLIERFEKTYNKAKEFLQQINEELDDRKSLQTEVEHTVKWLKEAQDDILKLEIPDHDDDTERNLEKQKLLKEEIMLHMEQIYPLIQLQQTKYASVCDKMPEELQQQIDDMKKLEKDAGEMMKEKEQELLHLHKDRLEFYHLLKTITEWLTNTEKQLKKNIIDVEETSRKHKELTEEADVLREEIAALRHSGTEIVKHSCDPLEKQNIQKYLATVNQHWFAVQACLSDRKQQLAEVAHLFLTFDETALLLISWSDCAEEVVSSELVWNDFETIKSQVFTYKTLLNEIEENQGKVYYLKSVTKHLAHICDASSAVAKVASISQKVFSIQTQTKSCLGRLEEALTEIEQHEKELAALSQWVKQTKSQFSIGEPNLILLDQLSLQQKILKDIQKQKEKAHELSQKSKHLANGEYQCPLEAEVTSDINELYVSAKDHYMWLQNAISQQEQYEVDVGHLEKAVTKAQQKLIHSPVTVGNTEMPRKKIAEHNVPSGSEGNITTDEDQTDSTRVPSASFRGTTFAHIGLLPPADDKMVENEEKNFDMVMERHKRYQKFVQDVSSKLHLIRTKLFTRPPPVHMDIEQELKEHSDIVEDLKKIEEEISNMEALVSEIIENTDAEESKTVSRTTLSMLTDKAGSLQKLMDEKGCQLQEILKAKQMHIAAMSAYIERFDELKSWLSKKQTEFQMIPKASSDSTENMRKQLQENKDLQELLREPFKQLSDMAVQCDNLCDMETVASAEQLRSELVMLQNALLTFKLEVMERYNQLKMAIKETEKRQQNADSHESSALNQWDREKVTRSFQPENKIRITEKLSGYDLSEQQKLVQYLADSQVRSREPTSEATFHVSWEMLNNNLDKAKQVLLEKTQGKQAVEFGQALYPCSRLLLPEHVSCQLKELKHSLLSLKDCWASMQLTELQSHYQKTLWIFSQWLHSAQTQLFSLPSRKEIHGKLKENKILFQELSSLQTELKLLKQTTEHLVTYTSAEDKKNLIQMLFSKLNDQVLLLVSQVQIHIDDLTQWKQFDDKIQKLKADIKEIKYIIHVETTESNSDILMAKIKSLEAQLKIFEKDLSKLKKAGTLLSAVVDSQWMSNELADLQICYMECKRQVMEKKATLLQSVSIQKQYEQLLYDYEDFLSTAEDKLNVGRITVRDLGSLKQHFLAHKKFFSDLESQRVMLVSLAQQCNKTSELKLDLQETRLSGLTHVIQERAQRREQRLSQLISQWTNFDDQLQQLQNWLFSTEKELPKYDFREDFVDQIQKNLVLYTSIQKNLANVKSEVFQLADLGKQLLHYISCFNLELSVTNVADKWMELNAKIASEKKKNEALCSDLEIFTSEAAVLDSWLSTAKVKLAALTQLSDEDSQSIVLLREKVEKLLKFHNEFENQLALKNRVISIGQKIMHATPHKMAQIQQQLQDIQEQWNIISRDIGKAEEYLHQSQMNLLPSRQALHELSTFVTKLDDILQTDQKEQLVSLMDVKTMLNKYQSVKIELVSKQMTVNFVNQSVLEQSDSDSPSVLTEKADFAERLSRFNQCWLKVTANVADQLTMLSTLCSNWKELESNIKVLQEWFVELEEKIKAYQVIGAEVNVRHSLKECKMMQQHLLSKESDLKQFRSLANKISEFPGPILICHHKVTEDIDIISKSWIDLNEQLISLEKRLVDILHLWTTFSNEKQSLTDLLDEVEYYLSTNMTTAGDLSMIRIQLDKLKSLLEELRKKSQGREKFISLATQLMQLCEAPVHQKIQTTIEKIQSRSKTLTAELHNQAKCLEHSLNEWRNYDEMYTEFCRELDTTQQSVEELIHTSRDGEQQQECLDKFKILHKNLDDFQSKLVILYQLSDRITKNVNTTAIINMTTRQTALEQRLLQLRNMVSTQLKQLQDNLSDKSNFQHDYATIIKFLHKVEVVLADEDPDKSADDTVLKERMLQLKEVLAEFNSQTTKLDSLNEYGYKLALSQTQADQLKQLNHSWQKLKAEVVDRCWMLNDSILIHQDFTEKCTIWMTYLAQIETDLASNIPGKLEDLLSQQKKCETLSSGIIDKQHILYAIIEDGQQMLKSGDVNDRTQFQKTLELLAEQWQHIVSRVTQRKAIIDALVRQWHLIEQFQTWLTEKDSCLQSVNLELSSVWKIRDMIGKVKNIQNEFRLQEDIYHQLHNTGMQLLQYCDSATENQLQVSLTRLQQHWSEVLKELDEQFSRLHGAMIQWDQCEEEIEELFVWLRESRTMLTLQLPETFDGLEVELHQCKDLQVSLGNLQDKYQNVFAKVRQLHQVVQLEDVSILAQRTLLLSKQWEELYHQTDVKIQQIREKLQIWTHFSQSVKDFCEWCEKMETKILTTKEYNIEKLLLKFEKEYEDEMMEKDTVKSELIQQGQRLKKISSEFRSVDIQDKTERIEDRWQHLQSVIICRKHKLQETLQAIQQLDLNINSLKKWLQNIENELRSPLIYQKCDFTEIQKKLQYQQKIQKDIEQHSAAVASVLNLCEVLLHDSDACPTENEFNTLNNVKTSFEKRWQNICTLFPEKYSRIEETWQLWQTFNADCKNLCVWLENMEQAVQEFEEASVMTKENIRHYENLQQKIHDNINQLDNINKQYRHLSREDCTDCEGSLRERMHDVNYRWDKLCKHIRGITSSAKWTVDAWEEFHIMFISLFNWLKKVDKSLKDLETSNQSDVSRIIEQLQMNVESKLNKVNQFEQMAEDLVQKSDSALTERVQQELDEFHDLYDWVRGQLEAWHIKLPRIMDQPLLSSDQLLGELADILEDAAQKLIIAEEELRSPTPVGPELIRRTSLYIQIMADCQAAIDNVQKMYNHVKTELGSSHLSCAEHEVSSIMYRWENLKAKVIEKDQKLQENRKEWSQFNCDLNSLLTWLTDVNAWLNAQAELLSKRDIGRVEKVFQQLKDFQVEIDGKKSIVQSLELASVTFTQGASEENKKVKKKIQLLNHQWVCMLSRSEDLEIKLQMALMESPDFLSEVKNLLAWTEKMESKLQQCEPLSVDKDETTLRKKQSQLLVLKSAIESKLPHIMAMKETAGQLYMGNQCEELARSKDSMHIVAKRNCTLLRCCQTFLAILDTKLELKESASISKLVKHMHTDGIDAYFPMNVLEQRFPNQCAVKFCTKPLDVQRSWNRSRFHQLRKLVFGEPRPQPPHTLDRNNSDTKENAEPPATPFWTRVLKAALPLQLLLLSLLGAALLLPMTADENYCNFSNTLHRSFSLMLNYVGGPPPV